MNITKLKYTKEKGEIIMYDYLVNYSIGTNSARYEEVVRTQSESAAKQMIINKFPGQLVHIWRVTRR